MRSKHRVCIIKYEDLLIKKIIKYEDGIINFQITYEVERWALDGR
jgi:hypothetical protein